MHFVWISLVSENMHHIYTATIPHQHTTVTAIYQDIKRKPGRSPRIAALTGHNPGLAHMSEVVRTIIIIGLAHYMSQTYTLISETAAEKFTSSTLVRPQRRTVHPNSPVWLSTGSGCENKLKCNLYLCAHVFADDFALQPPHTHTNSPHHTWAALAIVCMHKCGACVELALCGL